MWWSLWGEEFVGSRWRQLSERRSRSLGNIHRGLADALETNIRSITPEFQPVKAYVAHRHPANDHLSIEDAVRQIHKYKLWDLARAAE